MVIICVIMCSCLVNGLEVRLKVVLFGSVMVVFGSVVMFVVLSVD